MTLRLGEKAAVIQVFDLEEPNSAKRMRYFSHVHKAVSFLFTIIPEWKEPCMRIFMLDGPFDLEDQYLLFVTNGGLIKYSGWPPKPCITRTTEEIEQQAALRHREAINTYEGSRGEI